MIIAAEYIRDYMLKIFYKDGSHTVIDFEHFLKTNQNIMNTQFLDKTLFMKFSVEDGIIVWTGPHGEMDFDDEHVNYINQSA